MGHAFPSTQLDNWPTHLHQVVEDAQAVRVLAVLHLQTQGGTGTAREVLFTNTTFRTLCSWVLAVVHLQHAAQLTSSEVRHNLNLRLPKYVRNLQATMLMSLLLSTCNHLHLPHKITVPQRHSFAFRLVRTPTCSTLPSLVAVNEMCWPPSTTSSS